MMKTIIHIGYPKAASTMLQMNIFNNSELQLGSIPRSAIDQYILEPDCYSFNTETSKKEINNYINNLLMKKLTPILSSELLCGNANLNGGYNSVIYADRLKSIIPQAKIIIVIREQLSWLMSFYKMEVCYNKKTYSLDELLATSNGVDKVSKFLPSFLLYDKLINYYHRIYGKENTLIIPYELLVIEPDKFLYKIISFIKNNHLDISDIPIHQVNKGMTMEFTQIRRYTNMITQYYTGNDEIIFNRFCQFFSKFIRSRNKWSTEYFSATYPQLVKEISLSNERTALLSNISLKKYGYI